MKKNAARLLSALLVVCLMSQTLPAVWAADNVCVSVDENFVSVADAAADPDAAVSESEDGEEQADAGSPLQTGDDDLTPGGAGQPDDGQPPEEGSDPDDPAQRPEADGEADAAERSEADADDEAPLADDDGPDADTELQPPLPAQDDADTNEPVWQEVEMFAASDPDILTASSRVTESGLQLTVEYPRNIPFGEPITFRLIGHGNDEYGYAYLRGSVEMQVNGVWDYVLDTASFENRIVETNEFSFTFYAPGTYSFRFYLYAADSNGRYPEYVHAQFDVTLPDNDPNYPSVEKIVEDVAAECKSLYPDGSPDVDYNRALWLHDWLLNNCTYDYSYYYCGPEGALARGTGTCEAYHRAYVLLLNKVGIQTGRIVGNGHVWTAVKMDGDWYQVDLTWDASCHARHTDYTSDDYELHMYFGLTDEIIHAAHSDHKPNAGYESNSLKYNYYVKSGIAAQWGSAYLDEIRSNIRAGKTHFSVSTANKPTTDVSEYYVYDVYYKYIMPPVAYYFSTLDWTDPKGNQVELSVVYNADTKAFDFICTYGYGQALLLAVNDGTVQGYHIEKTLDAKNGSLTGLLFEKDVPGAATASSTITLAAHYDTFAGDPIAASANYASSNPAVIAVNSAGVLTVKGLGTAVITATAKDGSGLHSSVTVRVEDYLPRVTKQTISFNAALAANGVVTLAAAEGSELAALAENTLPRFMTRNKGVYTETDLVRVVNYDSATGRAEVRTKGNRAYQGTLYLEIPVDVTREGGAKGQLLYVPVAFNVTRTIPAANVSIPAFNLFYKNVYTPMTVTGLPAGVTLENITMAPASTANASLCNDGFSAELQGGKWVVNADAAKAYLAQNPTKALSAINRVYNIYFYYTGYAEPYVKKVTIPASLTAPKVTLSPASATINTTSGITTLPFTVNVNGSPAAVAPQSMTPQSAAAGKTSYKDRITIQPRDESAEASAYYVLDVADLAGKNISDITIQVKPQAADWIRPVAATFKVNVSAKALVPALSTGTLTLNTTWADGGAGTVRMSIRDVVGFEFATGDGSLTATPANAASAGMIDFVSIDADGVITLKPGAQAVPGKTYTYQLTAHYGPENTALSPVKLNVKVVDTLPSLSAAAVTLDVAKIAQRTAATQLKLSDTKHYTFALAGQKGCILLTAKNGVEQTDPAMLGKAPVFEGLGADGSLTFTAVPQATAAGTYYFRVTADIANNGGDPVKTQGIVVQVTVRDTKPAVSLTATSLTMNIALSNPVVRTTVKPMSAANKAAYGNMSYDDFVIVMTAWPAGGEGKITASLPNAGGEITFTPARDDATQNVTAPTGTYQFTVKPALKGGDGTAMLMGKAQTVTIRVNNSLPAVRLKAGTLTMNTAMRNAVVTTTLTDPSTISKGAYGTGYAGCTVTLVDGKGKALNDPDELSSLITLSAGGLVTVNEGASQFEDGKSYRFKLVPELQQPDNNNVLPLSPVYLTVKTVHTLPKATASSTTVLFNTNAGTTSRTAVVQLSSMSAYGGYRPYQSIIVTAPKGGYSSDISVAFYALADGSAQLSITANRTLKGDYTVALTPMLNIWETVSNRLVLTVKSTSAAASIAVSGKGSLNLQDRANTQIVYTLTRKNTNAPITNVTLAKGAELFDIMPDVEYLPNGDARVTLKLKDGAWQARTKTAVKFRTTLKTTASGGTMALDSPTVYVTPTEFSLRGKAQTVDSNVIYQSLPLSGRSVTMKVALTDPPSVKVTDAENPSVVSKAPLTIANISTAKLSAVYQDAFKITDWDPADGTFKIRLANPSLIKPGTYKLTLLAQPAGTSATGGYAFTATVVVKR